MSVESAATGTGGWESPATAESASMASLTEDVATKVMASKAVAMVIKLVLKALAMLPLSPKLAKLAKTQKS